MKYVISIILILILLIPFGYFAEPANAQVYLISNEIANSQVNQYFFVNCDSDECFSLLKALAPDWTEEGADKVSVQPVIVDKDTVALAAENAPVEDVQSESAVLNSDVKQAVGQTIESIAQTVINYQPGAIRINEIMAAPNTGEREWVELFNASSADIDLTSWKMEEGAGKLTSLSGLLKSGGYVVFDKDSLNNDGDTVILLDPTGKIIDQVSYGIWDDGNKSDNAPSLAKGQSIILIDSAYKATNQPTPNALNILDAPLVVVSSTTASTVNNNAVSSAVNPSAAAVVSAVEPQPVQQKLIVVDNQQPAQIKYQYSDLIRINELLINPIGNDDGEWIELYNKGEEDVNLIGWGIADEEKRSAPVIIKDSLLIRSESYILLPRSQTGIALNNSGDSLVLKDFADKIISEVSYDKSSENKSYAFFDGGWLETAVLTPGAENKKNDLQISKAGASTEKPSVAKLSTAKAKSSGVYKRVSISDAKKMPLKAKAVVTGRIIVLPNVFSKQYLYIQAEDGLGIQIYFNKADWPELNDGDAIEVSGIVSESRGEKKINISKDSDIKIFDGQASPDPIAVDNDKIKDFEGGLVRLEGEYLEKIGSANFIFANDQGEFEIYAKSSSGNDFSGLRQGTKYSVTGLVNKSGNSFQIKPRGLNDIKPAINAENNEIQPEPTAGAPDNSKSAVVIVLSALLGIIAVVNGLHFFFQQKKISAKDFFISRVIPKFKSFRGF